MYCIKSGSPGCIKQQIQKLLLNLCALLEMDGARHVFVATSKQEVIWYGYTRFPKKRCRNYHPISNRAIFATYLSHHCRVMRIVTVLAADQCLKIRWEGSTHEGMTIKTSGVMPNLPKSHGIKDSSCRKFYVKADYSVIHRTSSNNWTHM